MNDRNSIGPLLVSFAAGVLAGTVASLLLAPKSGAQTRALIADKATGAKEAVTKVPEALREASEAGRKAFNKAVSG
jgi:gas vesicle protein